MEPNILQGHSDAQLLAEEVSAFLAPAATGKSLRGALKEGGLSLFSMQLGLPGWHFCLKQLLQPLDLLQGIVWASVELITGFFFCWVQHAILTCRTLLLLVWKLHTGVKRHGWRMFLRGLAQFTWGLSLLRTCGCCLETLLARMAWWPAWCFVGIVFRITRALEVTYEQAVRIAREEEEEEEGRTAGATVTSASTLLQRREEQI